MDTIDTTKYNTYSAGQTDPRTGKTIGEGKTISIPKTLNATDVVNNKTFTVPPTIPPTASAGFGEFLTSLNNTVKSNAQKVEEQKMKQQEAELAQGRTDIGTLMTQIGEAPLIREKTFVAEGGDIAKKEVDRLTSEIEAEQLANRRQIESLQKSGMTAEAAQGEAQRLTRESLSKQADLAILQNAALRKYDTASSIADRKLQMELEPMKARLDALKFFYGENKDLLTKSQDRAFQIKMKEEERAYNEYSDNKKNIYSLAMKMAENNAPSSAIQSVLQAKTPTEALNLGKSYLTNTTEQEIKKLQKMKLEQELGITAPGVQNPKNKAIMDATLEKINLINEIKNNPAISTTVGPSRTARQGYFVGVPFVGGIGSTPEAFFNRVSGDKQALIGSVSQLTDKQFLEAVLSLKSQGGTLGQLTEREGQKLQSAATKIANWEIKDKDGNVKGYNIDEESFNKELDILMNSATKIYEAAGGILPGTPKSLEAADEYTNMIIDGNALQVNPYSSAGYKF